MKALCILLICLTTGVLVLYPFVLMANLMSMAAVQPSTPLPLATRVSMFAFLGGSSLYPVAYLIGLIATLLNFQKNLRAALGWQAGVIGYLILVIAAMLSWLMLG